MCIEIRRMNMKQFTREEMEKRRKKFLRRLWVNKRTDENTIREKILTYAIKHSSLDKIILSDDELRDPDFLLSLYRTNILTTCYIEPTYHTDNIDLMLEYTRYRMIANEVTEFKGIKWYMQHYLYNDLVKNIEFVEKLGKIYPTCNLIDLVHHILSVGHEYDDAQNKEEIARVIQSFPTDFLTREARRFGARAIEFIPPHTPYIQEIIRAGIDHDGFSSLELMDPQYIPDCIDLVVKAYNKDGIRKLSNFVYDHLNPKKTRVQQVDGKRVSESYIDETLKNAQRAILSHPEIRKIIEMESTRQTENYGAKSVYLIRVKTPTIKSHEMTPSEAMMAFRTGNTDISELAYIPVIDEDEEPSERC